MRSETEPAPVPRVGVPVMGIYGRYIKRLADMILSLCMIVLLSPILLVLAVLIRVKLGAPVIFEQERPGLHERLFTLFKFRTMTSECDENRELLPDEVRLTRFGRFLRSTSLDELPELWNIALGDMAFVGPRPLLVRYLPYYREDERLRSTVRPGITGLAQIRGRNVLTWDDRFKTDVEYVKTLSFLNDLNIAIRTVAVVLNRKDVLVGSEHVLEDLDVERAGVSKGGC
ncbi:MAG: sugar transferase [Coriobacteriia bacterium]|nr:sugar transferase [Coriobacteriia bacterium]